MKPRNKIRRQSAWVDEKKERSRTKRAKRREAHETNAPKKQPITIEDKRVWKEPATKTRNTETRDAPIEDDERWLDDSDSDSDGDGDGDGDQGDLPDGDQAPTPQAQDDQDTSLAEFDDLLPQSTALPRILITTSRHSTLHKQARDLEELIPNSTYVPRSAHRYSYEYSIKEISRFAANRGFTALVVLTEDQKKPTGLTVILLSTSTELHFSIKSWVDGKVLPGHGRATNHYPELLLNNFCTPLGQFLGRALQQLFPASPELQGRQVLTIHNQRDYIFLRRHRYIIREQRETEKAIVGRDDRPILQGIRCGLQEIGPRMSLKLRIIRHQSATIWRWKADMDVKRTVFQL
ncbi:Brix-domain-containing protein [Xylaria grammica]|nr:Brix-domain-containing protein [Xylaria grammica]